MLLYSDVFRAIVVDASRSAAASRGKNCTGDRGLREGSDPLELIEDGRFVATIASTIPGIDAAISVDTSCVSTLRSVSVLRFVDFRLYTLDNRIYLYLH